MILLNYIIAQVKEYPTKSGLVSSGATSGFGIWGLLTNENTPRVIACIGGLLGIALTAMSMYHNYLLIKKAKK